VQPERSIKTKDGFLQKYQFMEEGFFYPKAQKKCTDGGKNQFD
jgi:hypothetical protein